jgi:hypothetical protein
LQLETGAAAINLRIVSSFVAVVSTAQSLFVIQESGAACRPNTVTHFADVNILIFYRKYQDPIDLFHLL